MPRLAPLRIAFLQDLAAQLRYAPKKTILRQLSSAESLAGELEPDRMYPEEWLIFRITSYRPQLEEPSMLVGEALITELSAFVEHLAEEAGLTEADFAGPTYDINDLCARWNVSRRTVERYRRRGLISYRVRDDRSNAHLLFTETAVQSFEERHEKLLHNAQQFERIDDDTRAKILEAAREVHSQTEASLQETANQLARRFARGRETIRQILLRHDESVEDPIFDVVSPLSARQRSLVHRAVNWGIAPAELARRFDRSPATIHRIVNERRAELLRPLDLDGPHDKSWQDRATPDPVLDDPAVTTGLDISPELDVARFVELARADPRLDVRWASTCATAYWRLLWQARSQRDQLSRYAPSARGLDEIETALRWATLIRRLLVQSQRALVVRSIEERLGHPLLELPAAQVQDLLRAAMHAAIEGIDHYDPFAGGSPAAPVSLALGKALGRAVIDRPKVPRASASGLRMNDWSKHLCPWQAFLDPDPRLRAVAAQLGEQHESALAARFGWDGAPPQTIAALTKRLGFSVRQFTALHREVLAAMHRTAGALDAPISH